MAALKKQDSSTGKTSGRSSKPAPELIGQMAGEYRILRKIGAGGFGAVYEAEHPLLKRRAAIKVLHSHPALDSAGVQRFIEEARAASQIRHRNIIDIFSFGTLANGQYFYAMDLIEGAPLDRYLQAKGPLAPEQALPLLKPIASALDALHAASIVHRDVKPGNIYLAWESSGEVVPKLLDFGLVKLLGDNAVVHSVTGVPMGTPHYMSPEQCRGEKVEARTDIYALGVVCHELLTGSRPFTGDSATSLLVAHVLHAPPRMSTVNPAVSPELDQPVLNMLAKEASERPASALDAIRALESAALNAGLTFGDGPAWLPRLPPPPPEPENHSLAIGDTVERSGLRTGPLQAVTSTSVRRVGIGTGALSLALLGLWLGSRQPTAAPEVPQPRSAGTAAVRAAIAAPIAPTTGPAETPSPLPAADPSEVPLLLHGAPAGAQVMLGDRKLGDASSPLQLPFGRTPLRLRVVAAGYLPLGLSITPDEPHELNVSLEKQSRGAQPKRPGVPRDLEDPF